MIYHYTSIHSLALILESRKIRFNRLDKVDDLRESQTVSGIEFGKYFFVSCWTDSDKEHIPLWNIYTPNMRGVRIGLTNMPFKMSPFKAPPSWNTSQTGDILSPIPFDEMFHDTYCIFPVFLTPEMFAGQVSYVPDISVVYKEKVELSTDHKGNTNLTIQNMPLLTRTKDDCWAFENEYRFVLLITPSIPASSGDINDQSFYEKLAQHVLTSFSKGVDPGIDFYDLQLDESVLNSVEITIGPRAEHSDRLIVEALLHKFTSNGKINNSILSIR